MGARNEFGILGMFLLATCVPGGTGNAGKVDSADELIAAHLQAIGGEAALAAIQTRTMYGYYDEGGEQHLHRFDQKRPNLIRITTGYDRETGAFGYAEGFDGAAWEYAFGVPARVTGMPATALKNASDFDGPFVNVECKGHVFEWRGRTTFLDLDVYEIAIGETSYYFDAETYLHTMTRSNVPFHGEGREEEIVATFGDFKPVGGVLIAHETTEAFLPQNEIMSRLLWTDVEVNADLPDEWFAPPPAEFEEHYQSFRRAALEGDVQQLGGLYGRFDAAARDHVRGQRENELNTLAYELMSHERWDRAIAVLELAVGAYPTSANLQHSLGEAFMLAGDAERSIASYERSIELDPSNAHARKMIDEQRGH